LDIVLDRTTPVVVAHAFNPSTREAEASLVYRVISRTARTTQRNPVSEKKKNLYKVSSRTARAIQRNPVLKNKTKQDRTTRNNPVAKGRGG
jgi:hypothetical protein